MRTIPIVQYIATNDIAARGRILSHHHQSLNWFKSQFFVDGETMCHLGSLFKLFFVLEVDATKAATKVALDMSCKIIFKIEMFL